MHDVKKSLLATAGVLGVIAAVVGGSLVRNRMEIGPGLSVGNSIAMDGLVSNVKGIPSSTEAAKDPISESTYFYQLTLLLEKEYVDPIKDERDLAIGAVHGMVSSLADSDSVYYKPNQLKALDARRSGTFEGIGVEVKLQYNEEELHKYQNSMLGTGGPEADANFDPILLIPTVVVTMVLPSSPAEIAGVRVGDRIMRVNGKWALSSQEVVDLRKLRAKFDKGEITSDEFQKTANVFRAKFESNMTPARVVDELMTGKDGTIELVWHSPDGADQNATINKTVMRAPAVKRVGNMVRLKFFTGAPEQFQKLRISGDTLTLDLRQSSAGDLDAMRECMEEIVPKGEYGTIVSEQAGESRKLTVQHGREKPLAIALIVDESTTGAAAVFAKALAGAGAATIVSGRLTENLPWIELVRLPDGSGYTLRTGRFVAKEEAQ